MTEEDHKTEQEVQKEQLAKIFSLLKEHESNFALGKTSEEEFQKQLSMYK